MATLRIGNLGLRQEPIGRLDDWRKVRRVDWRNIQMGLNEVTVWDCTKQTFEPNLPKSVPVPVVLTSSAVNPLGRIDKSVRDQRYARFVGWSGLGSIKAFGNALANVFSTPTIPFPRAKILSQIDKRYRHVICYERFDRHILLVPDRPNPRGDYLILCLPERVRWWAMTVGICGTERELEHLAEDPFGGLEAPRWITYVFTAAGPYKKLPAPRKKLILTNDGSNILADPWEYLLPITAKGRVWRSLEREDRRLKKSYAREEGVGTGPYSRYEMDFTPEIPFLDARRAAELARLHDKYG